MNAKARGLGKGLGALIPSNDSVYREIPLTQIEVNPLQPRQHFDKAALKTLAESIKTVGVLQPIVVRATGAADQFELIAGERRWRAAKQAGIPTIPVVIKDSDDEASLVNAIIENTHREDLNALEEAAAYQQLIDDFGLTHAQVGEKLGKSRAVVTNALRLMSLPASVQRLIQERSLTAGHARALLGTEEKALQESLAKQAAKDDWSVRDVEQAVKGEGAGNSGAKSGPKSAAARSKNTKTTSATGPVALLEVQNQLEELLSTQVSVKLAAGTGKIQIWFADLPDLGRISGILGISEGSSTT